MAGPDISSWASSIRAGDIRSLARAASAIENRTPESAALLRELFPFTGHAAILGITGPPGAGKSTLVDQMTRICRASSKTVGIVAVDPSSPFSGGAILGDRIRMQHHHADPGVFIRSLATRGWTGGLARAATDMTLLLDAAGRDIILVETVGVGQDEIEIARLAEVAILVLVPGMGDDVQAIKAGIMEIADVFVINKADLPGADRMERDIRANLSLGMRQDGWVPPVTRTIANEGTGVAEALDHAFRYRETHGRDLEHGTEIWSLRLREMLRERVLEGISDSDIRSLAAGVASRKCDPFAAVDELLKTLRHV